MGARLPLLLPTAVADPVEEGLDDARQLVLELLRRRVRLARDQLFQALVTVLLDRGLVLAPLPPRSGRTCGGVRLRALA